ncbi:microcystin degradation protein MlrC [Anaerobacterium chartisolvens]|uniref:Microcystin degradation protein MlrC n=1 Tax=Anaerobacterium chartisolvens TaxID=1297424 RepID=A0A369BB66_9FIRM|nr:M81 family metallopeptidase [Anaerobacterium chartisolvens]RCX18770.1 microcystin degradation protein MlrC [Anaerobacterium chartisolvens]
MKVLVGSFQCESNTFCKKKASLEDFEIVQGTEVIDRLAASGVFADNGFEIIPAVFASALPSGEVRQQAFNYVRDVILKVIDDNPGIDAVYLYLHGAMCVEGIGSGEEALITAIRQKIGMNILIGVALDFHANNTSEFIKKVNIVYGFRTAPHIDHDQTEIRTAEALCRRALKRQLPVTVMFKAPVLGADAATTDKYPLKDMMEMLEPLDSNEDIASAAVFNGQPWVDYEFTGPSVVISYINNRELAVEAARRISAIHWEGRGSFRFDVPALEPVQAIESAIKSDRLPVFITDSGDNTTAGAEGEGTLMLRLLMESKADNVLVCGINDREKTNELLKMNIGDEVDAVIGESSHESFVIPTAVKGKILNKTKVTGWAGEDAGDAVVIDLGQIHLVITNERAAFISPAHIEGLGLKLSDYKIIVLKMGYLFPKLVPVAGEVIFALTPGTSTNVFSSLGYKNITRPIYPIDTDFEWTPVQIV